MWLVNTAISAYTAVQTGNVLGLAGGIVGGAVFGAIGKSLALGIAGNMSEGFANSFAGGALTGAVEFGISGFGAGFGGGLAGGVGFEGAMRLGGIGAASGAAYGAVIQGSYMAGWQNGMHGASKAEIAASQNKVRVMKGIRGIHTGIQIEGTGEYDGRFGFNPDFQSKEYDGGKVLLGGNVPGKIYTDKTGEKPYWITITKSTDVDYAKNIYNSVQADMNKTNSTYNLYGWNCYDWRDGKFNEAETLSR